MAKVHFFQSLSTNSECERIVKKLLNRITWLDSGRCAWAVCNLDNEKFRFKDIDQCDGQVLFWSLFHFAHSTLNSNVIGCDLSIDRFFENSTITWICLPYNPISRPFIMLMYNSMTTNVSLGGTEKNRMFMLSKYVGIAAIAKSTLFICVQAVSVLGIGSPWVIRTKRVDVIIQQTHISHGSCAIMHDHDFYIFNI